jgi:hypothetical protein
MAATVKLLSSEIALSSTANNISLASVVRCYNNTAAQVTMTRAFANTTTIGTCTLASGAVEFYIKSPTDTIACSGTIRAVSVASTN